MTAVFTPQEPRDQREFVNGVDEFGEFQFRRVGLQDIDTQGRWNAKAFSSTKNTISIGEKYFTLDEDKGNFKVGDDVLITSLNDITCFMWAEIVAVDTTAAPVRITVHVEDVSAVSNEDSRWEIQVIGRPKFGITKDTSTSSVDPTGDGPFTFTVTAGKFFPIGGKLLLIPLAAREIALVGLVEAYSGTTLTVTKNSTNATVPTSYDAWAVALLDAPQNKISMTAIDGLRIAASAGDIINDFTVGRGSVRDSTDTLDLVLAESMTKRLDALWVAGDAQGAAFRVLLAGSIGSSGTAVTGSGTTFVNDFGAIAAGGNLEDLNAQQAVVAQTQQYGSPPGANYASLISTASAIATAVVGSDTAITTNAALGAAPGAAYYRGGAASGSAILYYAVCVVRKDSDGSVDVVACSTRGGTDPQPDLPAGYTFYRVIGVLTWNGVDRIVALQFLHLVSATRGNEIQISLNNGTGYLDILFNAHLSDPTGAHAASSITYDGGSGLSSTDVEAAIDELAMEKANATDLTAHISDTSAAHAASAVSFSPTGSVAATDVQSAIAEVDGDVTAHVADTTAAHAASAISFSPTGNVAATTVQAAIAEVDSEKLAAASYTAADVLSKLLTVDGAGSGLDADLLDGQSSAHYATDADVTVLEGLVASNQLASGTYTPTLTSGANVAGTTSGVCCYMRVGSVVTVSGSISVDPTAGASTLTVVNISLPIASNLGAAADANGTASSTFAELINLRADATNNNMEMQWLSLTANNHAFYFIFQYRII